MTVTIPPPPGEQHRRSPFTPTFGATPPTLVGRQQEVNDFAYALDNGPGSKGRATFVTGQRGVGKSVMLSVYSQIAATRGWMSVNESASAGFARKLTEARLPEALEQLDTAHLTKSKTIGVNATVLGVGGGFTNRTESTNTLVPDFRHQLMRTLDILDKNETGLLITLDEVHRSQLGELQEITDAISYAVAQEAPIAFVGAGLPETINGLVNADISTYLRRAERVTLENLTPEDTRLALETPIRESGGQISDAALELAVEGTGNYPYLVQLVGDESWRAAAGGDIRESHVHAALDTAERSMFRQIHEPMIESLSGREREYLHAMTNDEGRSSTGDIARRMAIDAQHASVYRDRLLTEGVIEPAGRGYVTFAVPYTDSYLRTHTGRSQASHAEVATSRERTATRTRQSPGQSRYMQETSPRERLFGGTGRSSSSDSTYQDRQRQQRETRREAGPERGR